MNDLIPPSHPVPQTPRTPGPSGDADQDAFWGQAPEIEFSPVHRGPRKSRLYAASAGALLLTLGMGWAAADKIAGYFGPSLPDAAETQGGGGSQRRAGAAPGNRRASRPCRNAEEQAGSAGAEIPLR